MKPPLVLYGSVSTDDGAGGNRPVVLQVPPDDVAALLSATELGRIDLVRVPRGAPSGAGSASGTG